eukprot:13776486-Ditylum_brightwellii.AAC.1
MGEQKEKLLFVLEKHAAVFQGKRGVWNGNDITLRLKPSAKPYFASPYPVPLPQQKQFKKELDRQEEEGIIQFLPPEEAEKSEWAFA